MQPFLKVQYSSAEFTAQMDRLYLVSAIALDVYKERMHGIEKQFGAHAKIPPLKGRKTAEDKLLRGGGLPKSPATLTDIVRGTLVFDDHASMFDAAKTLQKEGIVFSMKDRFHSEESAGYDESKSSAGGIVLKGAQDTGYRDINMLLRLDITVPCFPAVVGEADKTEVVTCICELQLNVNALLSAKELAHPVYEITRRQATFSKWMVGAEGLAFASAAADAARNPVSVSAFAARSAKEYRAFVARHPADAPYLCTCEKLLGDNDLQIAVVPLAELVDGVVEQGGERSLTAVKPHVGAFLALIADIVRARVSARSDDGAEGVVTGKWCTGDAAPKLTRKISLADAVGAVIVRQHEGNEAALDSTLMGFIGSEEASRERMQAKLLEAEDMRNALRKATVKHNEEYARVELDFLEQLLKKAPRRHPNPPVVASMTEEQRETERSLRGLDLSDFRPSVKAKKDALMLAIRKSTLAARSIGPATAGAAPARNLFEDYVVFYGQELDNLTALMPKLYDIFTFSTMRQIPESSPVPPASAAGGEAPSSGIISGESGEAPEPSGSKRRPLTVEELKSWKW